MYLKSESILFIYLLKRIDLLINISYNKMGSSCSSCCCSTESNDTTEELQVNPEVYVRYRTYRLEYEVNNEMVYLRERREIERREDEAFGRSKY